MMKKVVLDEEKYLRFYELIQIRTGIRIGDNRREVLTHALRASGESMECADLDQIFSRLQDAPTDSEVWNDLIRKVTIGETYFFRDPNTIETLRQHILPELITRHQSDRTLRLWSAGCANGEEPYTLAILLHQIISDIDQWKILILATDINRQSLSQAIAGCYRPWSFRETDSAIQFTYFTTNGHTFMLVPTVRQMVTFAYHNLTEDNYPSPANQTNNLDLILCQNVTLHLSPSLIYDIANRFYQCLSEGGWLIVGPSETHLEIYKQFQTIHFHGATVYQRISGIPTSPCLLTPDPEQIDPKVNHLLQLNSHTMMSSTHRGTQRTPPLENRSAVEGVDLFQQGQELMKQHRYEEARQFFLTYMARESNTATAYYRMACLEANAGRLNEAQKWAEQALDHDPFRSEVHYTLALIHQVQGELQEAISRFKKVIYLDSNFILAHFGLSHLYERIGKPLEADRHRTLTIHLASKLSPDTVLLGSDDLTAGQLLTMARIHHHQPNVI